MHNQIPLVQPDFVCKRIASGKPLHFIDVRSDREFSSSHARGAVSVPAELLNADKLSREFGPEAGISEPVYLICTAGFRARAAAEKLHAEGLNRIMVVDGGTDAWKKQRLPMYQTRLSLWNVPITPRRQAEFFAGLVMLLLAIKGLFLHPFFMGVAALAGVSLMFSAGSERFNLVRVFSRMPWNRANH